MGKFPGFLFAVLFVPAVYAGATYIGASTGVVPIVAKDRAAELSLLVALPLALSGAVKWWDIWVRSEPPVGVKWLMVPPGEFVSQACLRHGVLMLVAAGIAVVADGMLEKSEAPLPNEAELRAELADLDGQLLRATREDVRLFQQATTGADKEQAYRERARLGHKIQKLKGRHDEIRTTLDNDAEAKWRARFWSLLPAYLLFGSVLVASLSVPRKKGFDSGEPIRE